MRVILSMTTIPARNGTLDTTLDSLAKQSRSFDELIIWGANGVEFDGCLGSRHNLRQVFCKRLIDDRGPVCKLSILEEHSLQDDDLIVTIDDDIVYQPTWLEQLVAGAEKYPDCAVGFSGWNVSSFLLAYKDRDPKGGDYVFPGHHSPCDVLEGWAGVAYRKRFFYIDPILGFASVLHPLPMFRNVDDVWISWRLHCRSVQRRLLGAPLAFPRPNSLSGLHDRPDFVEMNRKAALVAFGDATPGEFIEER